MTSSLSLPNESFIEHVYRLLRSAPAGLSEYDLIQRLRAEQSPYVPQVALLDKLVLFRTHFTVFNALYILRDRLWADASAHLEISPLRLQLQDYRRAQPGLVVADPLRSYYLDIDQLNSTTLEDVEALLESFWSRYHEGDEIKHALSLFDLDKSASYSEIRQRYRQLVSLHHPDRGGSTERLQSLNGAMEALKRHYARSGTLQSF
ncbi:DnaJ-like protein [Pseudomonas duriflava]|uniref:DnaJ-like protein n=1 Tax=Pseudomonas duriflava TaxID=459528 RepID=A0A562QAK1_9PSED|nr:DNA-J related domain-containing protein [Pseudomonas duriflava]TWI53772.1 DnaJ-like protein [Pseudomonas duriflava]